MEAIHFTDDEVTTLHDAIKSCLNELHSEISYTDNRDFKAALKQKQHILQSAMDKLAEKVVQRA